MRLSKVFKAAALICLVIVIGVVVFVLPVKEYLTQFLERIQSLGVWGPIFLGIIYSLACLFFIPGSILTLGAGFAFGVVVGTITVSLASTLGALAAFFVGRTLMQNFVEAKVARYPKFQAFDQAVAKEGFKIVLLTRLSPIFPFNFLNYAYGVTQVRAWDYFWASWIGMLPGTVMYVYFGSAVKNVADLATGKIEGGMGQKILFGLGLVATVVATFFVTRLARKAIQNVLPNKK